jgi:uncharacterized phage protein (TIGR01671 family)
MMTVRPSRRMMSLLILNRLMREIKFRAWDASTKQMFENVQNSNGFDSWLHQPDCTVMQYTGLKDKNGKEIYEGDIVIGDLRNEFGSLQEDVRGQIAWNIKSAGFVTKIPGEEQTYFIGKYVEIIGNIYENSDLLK